MSARRSRKLPPDWRGLSAAIETSSFVDRWCPTAGAAHQRPEKARAVKRARWIWFVSKLLPDLIKLQKVKQ
jgi:hypothetical protein